MPFVFIGLSLEPISSGNSVRTLIFAHRMILRGSLCVIIVQKNILV